MKKVLIFSSLLAAGVIGGVTSQVAARPDSSPVSGEASSSPPRGSSRDSCFFADNIKDFYSENDYSMMVTDYHGRSFRLELSGACFGINTAIRIGLRARFGRMVCGPFDADVIYSDGTSTGRSGRCAITNVTPVSRAEAEAYDPSRDDKKKWDNKKKPAAQARP